MIKKMTYLTYCYKYTQEELERLTKLYKESPSIFGYDLQQKGLNGYIKYISKEFTSPTLYSIDQFTPKYIVNDNLNNGNTFNITRIVEVNIFGNIQRTILELPN